MNAKLPSLRLGSISKAAMRGGKLLAGLLVFCIMVNGFIPRFSIGAKDYEVLSQIMQRQSTLLRFFSFSTLPVKLVNDLFADSGVLPKAAHQKAPKPRDTNTTNTSTDYSLIAFDKTMNANRLGAVLRIGDAVPQAMHAGAAILAASERMMDEAPPGEWSVLLALILLCLMLPRSSVADGPASFSFVRSTSAQLARASWVFYLPSKGRPV